MKKFYFLIILQITNICAFSQNEMLIKWQKALGGTAYDQGRTVMPTSDSGYVMTGYVASIDGDVTGNNGSRDYWVVKLDSTGNIQWQKCLGGSNIDEAEDIKQTTDGGYIVVGFSTSNDGDVTVNKGYTDYWIVKLDNNGNLQWQKSYGGTDEDKAYAVQQTYDGGYVVAGHSRSNDGDVTGNHGNQDFWVIKLNSSGNLLWQKCYGGTNDDKAYSVIEISGGNLVVAGSTISVNGDVSANNGGVDYWLIKLDSNGNLLWEKTYGGSFTDIARSVKQTIDGGFIIAGNSNSTNGQISNNIGQVDYWIVKTDSLGNLQWQKSLGGSGYEFSYAVIQTSDGKYITAGNTNSIDGDVTGNNGNSDFWIVQLDAYGNKQWQKALGGTGSDGAHSLLQAIDGDIIVAGYTTSNNGNVTGNNGFSDYWLVKLTPQYNAITGNLFIDINGNNQYDTGESVLKNHPIYELNTNRFTFSNQNGDYYLTVLDTGNYIVYPSPLTHYTSIPVSHNIHFSGILETDTLNNFALQPLGPVNDLQVSIAPLGAFRPGFNAHYNIHYKNTGTTTIAGTLFFYPDTNVNYISSTVLPTSVSFDSIEWVLSALNPFEEGNISVTVNVQATAILGSIINSIVKIEPVQGDATPANNQTGWEVTVTGAFDPNDIIVNRELLYDTELINPPYLEYLIRFQNTGTDTAFTVKIKNPFPVNSDLATFEFVESSHPLTINYNNLDTLFWFVFDNILLPDSNVNEILSHGYIRYKVKPKSSLSVGDIIENRAEIYFDFNEPIITNTATTEIVSPPFIPEIKTPLNFDLYPNPTYDKVSLKFTVFSPAEVKIEIYNSLGILIHSKINKLHMGENTYSYSTEKIPAGIYNLRLLMDENSAAKKFIKY